MSTILKLGDGAVLDGIFGAASKTRILVTASNKTNFLVTVLIVTLFVIVVKFAFFNYSYYYKVKDMIFDVMRSLSIQAYDSAATTQDFDTYIVNISKYLDTNVDANKRLDVLNQESSNYIDFHNYICVYKFFIIATALLWLLMFIIAVKYSRYATDFTSAGVVNR